MKRLFCVMIAVILSVFSTGCNRHNTTKTNIATFYYIHNDINYGTTSGVIAPMTVELPGGALNYKTVLDQYFNGPTNYDCISPFPAGISLEDIQFNNDRAELLLSPHMAILADASMTVALACLTRTVIELTDVKAVQISIQNNQINGSDTITLTLNNFAYFDDVQPVS